MLVKNLALKETYQLPVDCVFLAIGHTPNTAQFSKLIEIDPQGYIMLEGRTQATSVEGIFAAGDATDPRYKQAAKASGDAVAAALEAIAFLHERGFSVKQASLLSDYYFKTQEEST